MTAVGQVRTSGTTARMVCCWGEADEIGAKAEVAARRSALGGGADVRVAWPESPLLAISRLSRLP